MLKLLKKNLILLLFFVSSIAVMIIAFYAQSMMQRSAAIIGETSREKMVALSRAAALLTTADELEQYKAPEDMASEGYKALQQKLMDFTDDSGIAFTYYLKLDRETNMMQFIADNEIGRAHV